MKKNRSARKSFPIYLIEKLNLKERARAHVPEERSSTLKHSSRNLSSSLSYTSARLTGESCSGTSNFSAIRRHKKTTTQS